MVVGSLYNKRLCKSKKLFPELHGSFFETKKTERDLEPKVYFKIKQLKAVSRTAQKVL
jgi:hypothetical protein